MIRQKIWADVWPSRTGGAESDEMLRVYAHFNHEAADPRAGGHWAAEWPRRAEPGHYEGEALGFPPLCFLAAGAQWLGKPSDSIPKRDLRLQPVWNIGPYGIFQFQKKGSILISSKASTCIWKYARVKSRSRQAVGPWRHVPAENSEIAFSPSGNMVFKRSFQRSMHPRSFSSASLRGVLHVQPHTGWSSAPHSSHPLHSGSQAQYLWMSAIAQLLLSSAEVWLVHQDENVCSNPSSVFLKAVSTRFTYNFIPLCGKVDHLNKLIV